jgi:hypothetical protein
MVRTNVAVLFLVFHFDSQETRVYRLISVLSFTSYSAFLRFLLSLDILQASGLISKLYFNYLTDNLFTVRVSLWMILFRLKDSYLCK